MASQVIGWFIWSTVEAYVIYCDNQSCIKLLENPVFHDRSKHIEINTTSSKTMFREGQLSFNTYPQMSR
jgi:hypothetical protein